MRKINRIGNEFGALTVVAEAGSMGGGMAWLCRCKCGRTTTVRAGDLQSGNTKSCGCRATVTTHGHARKRMHSAEYRTWERIKQRCHNPKYPRFADWGGRGISVCERWMDSFEAFFEDMGSKPSPGHSIDRIDNDGNYEPGNCRWATAAEQSSNRTRSA